MKGEIGRTRSGEAVAKESRRGWGAKFAQGKCNKTKPIESLFATLQAENKANQTQFIGFLVNRRSMLCPRKRAVRAHEVDSSSEARP
jgi:hypothetical protein